MRRITGVLMRPRSTMTALVAAPACLVCWIVILVIWLACASWLLSTAVGRQALVDERVRIVEAFGGRIDDAQYAALQASPPVITYFTSGGRLLLSPPVTLAVAPEIAPCSAADPTASGPRHSAGEEGGVWAVGGTSQRGRDGPGPCELDDGWV